MRGLTDIKLLCTTPGSLHCPLGNNSFQASITKIKDVCSQSFSLATSHASYSTNSKMTTSRFRNLCSLRPKTERPKT